MTITLQSETKTVNMGGWGSQIQLQEVPALVDMLGYGFKVTLKSVKVSVTFLPLGADAAKSGHWTGPVFAGVISNGHAEKVLGSAPDSTKALKLHGLHPVVTPGTAQGQTVLLDLAFKHADLFAASSKLAERVVVSTAHSVAGSETKNAVSLTTIIEVEASS